MSYPKVFGYRILFIFIPIFRVEKTGINFKGQFYSWESIREVKILEYSNMHRRSLYQDPVDVVMDNKIAYATRIYKSGMEIIFDSKKLSIPFGMCLLEKKSLPFADLFNDGRSKACKEFQEMLNDHISNKITRSNKKNLWLTTQLRFLTFGNIVFLISLICFVLVAVLGIALSILVE